MPKEQQYAIQQTQVLNPISTPEATQVVAHPVDQIVAPVVDTQLHQLVSGLSAVHPGLEKYLHEKGTTDAMTAVAVGEDLARRDSLNAVSPLEALKQPSAMPDTVSPAYAKNFQTGYSNVLGTSIANKSQDDALTAWSKLLPGEKTDPEGFLKKFAQENMAGFDNPLVLAAVSKKFEQTAAAIRGDARSVATKQLIDSTKEQIQSTFSTITTDQTTDQQVAAFVALRDEARKTGVYTNTELVAQFADHLHTLSLRQGGDPSVFDAFEGKDPATGKLFREMNPDVAAKVDAYRKVADAQVDKRLDAAMQPTLFVQQRDLEAKVMALGTLPDVATMQSMIGKLAPFKSADELTSWTHKMQVELDKQASTKHALDAIRNGDGASIIKPEDQQKAMNMVTDPHVQLLIAASHDPSEKGQAAQNAAIGMILKVTDRAGVNVANTTLKNLGHALVNRIPGKDEDADASFKMMANFYRQVPDNIKNLYFPDDAKAILDHYNSATTNGPMTQLDSKTAFQQAYSILSPEAKQLAEKMRKDPDWNAHVESKVKNLTTGWFRDVFAPKWTGLYPDNEPEMAQFAKNEGIRYAVANPSRSQSDVMNHVQSWYRERFIHDTTSNKVIEVPGGQANDSVAAAIAGYTADARKKFGADDAELRLVGSTYQLTSPGAAGHMLDTGIKLEDITRHAYLKKNWDVSQQEGAKMQTFQKALLGGTATSQDLTDAAPLIAKARNMGQWSREMDSRLQTFRSDSLKKDMDAMINIPASDPTSQNLGYALAKSDGRSMTTLARTYWDRGAMGEALTVMNEGVKLRAYGDNKGSAIGVGYNMDMNVKTISEDFRRSGIPVDSVDAIRAGKASITEDQAMRLFAISYGRAKDVAQAGVDAKYGKGSWMKLAQNKQAVMADVAYQVGSLSKFGPSMEALINGDKAAADNSFKVKYARRSDGVMIEDTPRNNLRSHLLNGTGTFSAVIDEVAAKPRSLIEAKLAQQ